jgi:hypothetical protein
VVNGCVTSTVLSAGWLFITVTVFGKLSKLSVKDVCTTVVGEKVVDSVVIELASAFSMIVIVLPVGSTTTIVLFYVTTLIEFDSITNSFRQD